MIYVCDKCLQASCWAGIFMCWEAREAGLYRATRPQLRKLALEHESYWGREEVIAPRSDKSTPTLPNAVVREILNLRNPNPNPEPRTQKEKRDADEPDRDG